MIAQVSWRPPSCCISSFRAHRVVAIEVVDDDLLTFLYSNAQNTRAHSCRKRMVKTCLFLVSASTFLICGGRTGVDYQGKPPSYTVGKAEYLFFSLRYFPPISWTLYTNISEKYSSLYVLMSFQNYFGFFRTLTFRDIWRKIPRLILKLIVDSYLLHFPDIIQHDWSRG